LKIKGLARQFEGGGYYRIQLPLDELAKHGHETSLERARTDADVLGTDIIVGQLIGGHENPELIHNWWRSQVRHARLVYELDDNPFEIEAHNPAIAAYGHPAAQDSIAHCIEVASLVTASTEPLAEEMRKFNPNVVVLKNRIDEHMLSIERPRRDKLVIGWAGGGSHIEDMKICARGLRKTLERHPDVEAHFIGAPLGPLVKHPVRFTRWAAKTTDYYKLIDFDIGLAPLLPSVFTRSKSYIKALEYAALGIPVIASDVEPYRDFVVDGVTGWLVRRDHEWATRMRDLINDESMRAEMGAKAKEVAAQYTIQRGWTEWETAYKGILS
jgi:glycosyltransferase involved in cell wall biosynthesis